MKIEATLVNSKTTVTSKVIVGIALALVLAWTSGTAWAKDSMAVSVTNATGAPVIVSNGQAVGTIQLFYTVNADQFAVGEFASFDVNWVTSAGSGKATDYGSGIIFTLSQDQQGGYVDLAANPNAFTLTATGQNGTSRVTVYIAPDKAGNLPPSADGTDLVGNLKLDAGSKVGTVTNIQVHIRLVHPTECVKVYNFVTDQDFNLGILDSTSLNVPANGKNAGKVVSSQPGQFSDNVLIANTCATDQSFDLKIGLDSSFTTQGANAVRTYTAAGEFDSTSFNAIMSAGGAPNGTGLCLQNVTVPAGTSFLATVHSEVKKGLLQTLLPADGSFDFAASVYENVNAGCTGTPHSLTSPNPATFTLPFTR
jgi:hypothetical protein